MAEAGPSRLPDQAPEHPLPETPFYAVEYPGCVASTPESTSRAVHSLGGSTALATAFRRHAPRGDNLVELRLRPDNPFAHPVAGEVVGTNNLLLKVVKRRRKRRKGEQSPDEGDIIGEYTAEIMGSIPKTVRFRSEYINKKFLMCLV